MKITIDIPNNGDDLLVAYAAYGALAHALSASGNRLAYVPFEEIALLAAEAVNPEHVIIANITEERQPAITRPVYTTVVDPLHESPIQLPYTHIPVQMRQVRHRGRYIGASGLAQGQLFFTPMLLAEHGAMWNVDVCMRCGAPLFTPRRIRCNQCAAELAEASADLDAILARIKG